MERDYSKPQHELLAEMLLEQLGDMPGPHIHYTSTRYEPIVMTRSDNIRIANDCRIDSFVKLEGGSGLTIGPRVHIASFAHLNIGGGSLVVGDGAAFASGAKVISGGNTPDGRSMSASAHPDDQVLAYHRLVVGRNAAILSGAIVVGVDVGEGAVLAAGGVATKPLVPYGIYAGVPAKLIGWRKHDFVDAPTTEPDHCRVCGYARETPVGNHR